MKQFKFRVCIGQILNTTLLLCKSKKLIYLVRFINSSVQHSPIEITAQSGKVYIIVYIVLAGGERNKGKGSKGRPLRGRGGRLASVGYGVPLSLLLFFPLLRTPRNYWIIDCRINIFCIVLEFTIFMWLTFISHRRSNVVGSKCLSLRSAISR